MRPHLALLSLCSSLALVMTAGCAGHAPREGSNADPDSGALVFQDGSQRPAADQLVGAPDQGGPAPTPDLGVPAPTPDLGVPAPTPDQGVPSPTPDQGVPAPDVGSRPPASCALPWGGQVAHGQSVPAFQQATAVSPQLCSQLVQTRVCQNGVLSGSYTQSSCSQQYRGCAVPGYGSLLHGQQVMGFQASSVPCGQSCTQRTLSCVDGALQGGTYVANCKVRSCACRFGMAKGSVELPRGASCSANLLNVKTTVNCSGGIQTYPFFSCTYTCTASGTLIRSPGAPCEIGNGPCGGSVLTSSTTDCPAP